MIFPHTKISPSFHSTVSILFPSLNIFLFNLFPSRIFHQFRCLFSFIGCIHSLKVVSLLFDFFKQRLCHLSNFCVYVITSQFFKSFCESACIFFSSLSFNPVPCLSHNSLVHSSLITVHKIFVSLLKCVECVWSSFMLAFIRMHQNWKHSVLLFYFQIICFLRQF